MKLSVKEVAKLLNVEEKVIYGWIRKGEIPVQRISENYRFNRSEILEWAVSHGLAHSAPDPEESVEFPGLVAALQNGGVFYDIPGVDKSDVLRNVVKIMPLSNEVDRDFLYDVLLARENLGSTGMGEGIAIPHVRNPIVLHVNRPVITLCFLKTPIEFGSIDGLPVDTLFTMVSPTVRVHLHLLARLGFALRNPEFKTALKNRLPQDQLMQILGATDQALPTPASEQ